MSTSRMLWEVCGSPAVPECIEVGSGARCWVCAGEASRAMVRDDWTGASYTGQNKVKAPGSPWVCEPCVHIHSRIAPVPGRPPAEGKQFGGNFRNYSHLYERAEDGRITYENASKGQKPAILAFLRRPHHGLWWAAIADSGQKHVVPWTPVNHGKGAGHVLFDESVVSLPDAHGWTLVDDMIALLTAGATKEEITRGEYESGAWSRCRDRIVDFERAHAIKRHGAWFKLAIWLAQRDEVAVQERLSAEKANKAKKEDNGGRKGKGKTANTNGGDAPLPSSGVPRGGGESAQALGATTGQDAERSTTEPIARGMGDADVPQSATPSTVQLGFTFLAGPVEQRQRSRRGR